MRGVPPGDTSPGNRHTLASLGQPGQLVQVAVIVGRVAEVTASETFCLGVELTRLELVTPCLQNSADMFRTVPDVGLSACRDRLRSARFGVVATGRGYRRGRSSDPAIPPIGAQ
jgi:hypothetical protein